MNHTYPLDNVALCRVATIRPVVNPLYCGNSCQVNSREFALQAEGVGNFYACDGNRVEYSVADGADPDWYGFFLTGKSKNGLDPEYIYKFGI